jgi:predicted flap endonuclease-1-like 5' DNA nuclease
MTSLTTYNAIALIIAGIIGLIIGWWLFKRAIADGKRPASTTRSSAPRAEAPAPAPAAEPAPAAQKGEGKGLADEDAAAIADIAGQFLGVDVHAELPGASGPPDNLQTLKGVGGKLAAKLNDNGITRFDQLASLTTEQAAALDARMDQFKGRIARDRLIEQAGYLARDDREGFQARFGNLGSGS